MSLLVAKAKEQIKNALGAAAQSAINKGEFPDAELPAFAIEVPSNRDHLWNYRMHLSIEALASERAFNEALSAMITDARRGVRKG